MTIARRVFDRGGLGFDGTEAGHAQHADRLDRSVGQLGRSACLACQYGSSGCLGVDRVTFAALPSQPTVRARHFEYLHVLFVQVAGQAGPVGAGSFHTDPTGVAFTPHPRQHFSVTS
jgi:hypothetical protein